MGTTHKEVNLFILLVTSNNHFFLQTERKHTSNLLESDPRLCLERGHLFDHLEYISHLFDRDHLLIPLTKTKIAHSLNGLLQVGLLEGFNVDVAFQTFNSYYRFDLQGLGECTREKKIRSFNIIQLICNLQNSTKCYNLNNEQHLILQDVVF